MKIEKGLVQPYCPVQPNIHLCVTGGIQVVSAALTFDTKPHREMPALETGEQPQTTMLG